MIYQNILAGFVTSLLQLAYAFSFGGLIFEGSLKPYLANGVAISLVTAIALGVIVSWKSGFRSAIAGPDTNTATFQAAMMISLEPLLSNLPEEKALGVALTSLLVAAIVTGLVLLVLGMQGAGKFIRYIPFPVIAGFLASTGWLMAKGSLKMVIDTNATCAHSVNCLGENAASLILTAGWAIGLWILTEKIKSPLLTPLSMIGAIILTHLVWSTHLLDGLEIKYEYLMMPSPANGHSLSEFLSLGYLHPDFSGISLVYGDIISLVVIACITVLMNTTSVELATDSDVDLNHELRVHGIANITSALAGGYTGNTSVSRSLVNHSTGGVQRLSGYIVASVSFAVLISNVDIIGLIPKFVLAGLLLQLGVKLIWDWGWKSKANISRTDWIIVLILLSVTAWVGFIPALVFGLLACCISFVIKATSQNIITSKYDISCRKSSIIRSDEENKIISKHGPLAKVLVLKGFLFFGSAYSLYVQAIELIESQDTRLLILDMNQVNGIDSSAVATLGRLRKFLANRDIHASIVTTEKALVGVCSNQAWLLYKEIDDALMFGEDIIIAENPQEIMNRTMTEWLTEICCGNEFASSTLSRLLEPVSVRDDGVIGRAGDASEHLFFIEKGPVGVFVTGAKGEAYRVRMFHDLTVAGEMGFIMNTPRSADLVAVSGAKIWSLERLKYIEATKSTPDLERLILSYVIQLLSERLAFSSREIAILRAGAVSV